MREYLLQVMTERIDEYLAAGIPQQDGVDGLSDLCHSFFQWLDKDLEKGI